MYLKCNLFKNYLMKWMAAAIAQWIRLCLPSCCQAFESKAHHSTLLSICLWIGRVEKDKNKRKRGRDWSLYKNYQLIRIGPRAYPQQQWVHGLKYLLMIFAADFIPIRYLLRHLIWKINTKDDFLSFKLKAQIVIWRRNFFGFLHFCLND